MLEATGELGRTHVTSLPHHLAARVAISRSSLLITGETGAGKGFLARWIHDRSLRAGGPFIPVNCGAIPEGIVDSHLFGHARGSFSDAHADHLGLVRSADGGTLFLDEVGELPRKMQVRLLRLLEEREVQPVGSTAPISVDVRVIAATACDLPRLVAEGRLREDLFYRLNVIHLDIKPLRSRPGDVEGLVEEFNGDFADRAGRGRLRFTAGALRVLTRHPWPGNVRQLRTVLERLHVLCPHDTVQADDLRTYAQLEAPSRRPGPRLTLARARIDAIRRTMERCGGNVSHAAVALGVHRSTVHRWLARERMTA